MKHQLDHRLRLLATALLLSGTLLTCLFSCKKEEIPEDPVKGVVLTVSVSVPQAVLDVADIAVSMRTPYALETKSVDETKWVYHFEVAEPSGASPMPVHVDVSVKGREMEKGNEIFAGLRYAFSFDTVFESGAEEHIASFEKNVSGRIIWISSERRYGSFEPFNYAWRGEMKAAPKSPAKYIVEELILE